MTWSWPCSGFLGRMTAGILIGAMVAVAASSAAAADPIRDMQWHLGFLHVEEAHRYSQGDGVIVGVVDTGVDASHPDLAGSVLPGLGVGPEGNSHIDADGHGTAMAGIIAAHGRILGIAPKAQILPVKQADGSRVEGFAGGIRLAVDHGATVLCLAYGVDENPIDRADVQYAIDHDVVVIAGVGNTDLPVGGYPAGYPGVVGAAGVDRNGNHAAISVVSPNATLAAPAVDVVSTDTLQRAGSSGYGNGTGTSASTAIIAGAAALVRARFPRLPAAEVVRRLTATADDKGAPGRDDEYGYGIVNLVKALTADVPPATVPASPTLAPAAAAGPPRGGGGIPSWAIGLLIFGALAAAAVILGVVRRGAEPS